MTGKHRSGKQTKQAKQITASTVNQRTRGGVHSGKSDGREPYKWLGVGAVTLGMALASGAGVAHADDSGSDGSSSSGTGGASASGKGG